MASEIRYSISQSADPSVRWSVVELSVHDALSEPYEVVAEIAIDDDSMDPDALLGCDVRVTLERASVLRAFCGIVRRVEKGFGAPEASQEQPITLARIWVVPALEGLKHTRDLRIFQNKTAVEIAQAVLEEAFGPYGRSVDVGRLAAEYPTREYCVQYGESKFDFVSRLLEEEGIGYFFLHEGEQEEMVLFDALSQFEDVSHQGSGAIPLIPRTGVIGSEAEPVYELVHRASLTTTSIVVRDYDWTHPSTTIEANETAQDEQGRDREVFVFGETTFGGYQPDSGYGEQDSDRRAAIEAERVRVREHSYVGQSRVIGFSPGCTFALQGSGEAELDADYAIVRVDHTSRRGHGDTDRYHNRFECVEKSSAWRPPQVHRRVRAASVETAIVVGPPGEEIHTDERGRIKVQFHWDREGQNNEQSSCWMRVMQPWAGAGWGHLWIPRVGMEVIVHFLDGDPDRPIVLGSLYNGEHALPYSLPDEKTKSTIKSQSSPGGGGDNELRFEDKAGEEEIYLHAQKDLVEQVEHNHDTTVINNQTNKVKIDQTEDIGANQTMNVVANRTVHVKAAFDEKIDTGEKRTVTGGSTETITGGETRTVSGGVDETINGGETRTVTGAKSETITGSMIRSIGAASNETIDGPLSQTITGGATITTPSTYHINANSTSTILAPAGSLWVSPGGHKIVAAAGQTWIDNELFYFGTLTKDRFDSKAGAVGFVGTFIGVQLRIMGIKFDLYPYVAEIVQKGSKKGKQLNIFETNLWKNKIVPIASGISAWLGG